MITLYDASVLMPADVYVIAVGQVERGPIIVCEMRIR